MQRYGYIETVRRKIGSGPAETIRVCRLTKPGLYVITETPDDKLEKQRLKESGQKANLYDEGSSYLDCSERAIERRHEMLAMAKKKEFDASVKQRFYKYAEPLITDKNKSILIRESAKAKDVALNSTIKAERLYRHWRLANVNAFFIANHFLTTLDKTPMEYAMNIRDIHDADNEAPLDLKAFVEYTLAEWYQDFQYSLCYEKPKEDTSAETINRWYHKPVFYPYDCIPGFEPNNPDEDFNMIAKDLNNTARTFIGLACGVRANYIVYHTRPDRAEWNKKLEQDTISAIHDALEKANATAPNPHAENPTEYAMIFCPTIQQFKKLFETAKKRMGKRAGDNRNVNHPYDGIYIIPFNHAGVQQVRLLMTQNPIQLADNLVYKFRKNYPDTFTKSYSSVFPLTYNKTPVLMAHTMNFQQLFAAMEEYEKGANFYVSCYPELVKYIQQIMPDVQFL